MIKSRYKIICRIGREKKVEEDDSDDVETKKKEQKQKTSKQKYMNHIL